MNKFLNFFTAILFLSMAILISCGGSDDDGDGTDEDPIDISGTLLAAGTATLSGVTQDGVAVDGWDGFTLSFTFSSGTGGGTYATTGSGSDVVWPTSGTWSFVGTSTTQILRSDNTTMDLTLSESQISLGFDVVDPNGRLLTIGGKYSFVLVR